MDRLRQDGHDVRYVAEEVRSIPDEAVLDSSVQAGALLLTADKDFGELVYRQRRVSSGVILIRLAGLSPERKAEIVAAAIRQHGIQLADDFAVVAPGTVRIRRRPANRHDDGM